MILRPRPGLARLQAGRDEEGAGESDNGAGGERDFQTAHEGSSCGPRQQRPGGAAGSAGYLEGTAKGPEDGVRGSDRHVPAGKRCGHVILVTS